ncbi:MAG: helix-turn-helix transcriptional regulator [Nitrolancea sp.]
MRELRLRQGLTLAELAARCGLSHAMISRIEQGKRDVTLQNLMRLSAALEVEVTYFTSFHEESWRTEQELAQVLRDIEIDEQSIQQILILSYEAQGSLLDGLRWLTIPERVHPLRAKELVDHVLAHGVRASVPYILSGIDQFGIDVEGFCRTLTQMEELSGERLTITDRVLNFSLPIEEQINFVDVYRSIFQREPDDPAMLRWWVQAMRSALRENTERFESRIIYPRTAIESYIRSGHWGEGVDVNPVRVRAQIISLAQSLRSNPHMSVGLLDEPVPFNLLIKGKRQAMAYVYRDQRVFPSQTGGLAFRSTRTDVVLEFRDYFEDLWESIPADGRDRDSVANWLEAQIAATTHPG